MRGRIKSPAFALLAVIAVLGSSVEGQWTIERLPDVDTPSNAAVFSGPGGGAMAHSQFELPMDLDALSDEELIELYVETVSSSPRRDVLDTSSLASDTWLVQFGYSYSLNRDDADFRTDQHTAPELLVRYRYSDRVELRVGWSGVTFDTLTDELSGLSDRQTTSASPSIGARFALWPQRRFLPRASLTVSSPFDMDSRSNFFNRLDPLASVGYSWQLRERWLAAGATAAVWNQQDDASYLDMQQSISIVRLLGEKWDVSVTWSALFPEGLAMTSTIGPGISYRWSDAIQVDVLSSTALDPRSPDALMQCFVTYRR